MIFCYFLNIKSRSLMHRTANATQSDGERNPIGRRTESDRTADATRSDGGRKPIGWRTEPDRTADGIGDEKKSEVKQDELISATPFILNMLPRGTV